MDQMYTKYLAKDFLFWPTCLKEISPQKRNQLHEISEQQEALIIDMGAEHGRAGFNSSKGPQIVFRSQISKNKDFNKQDQPTKSSVNVSYDQLDFIKVNFKPLFERNLIENSTLLEQCCDYIFGELVKPLNRLQCPIVISEPFFNPPGCRKMLLELMFDCYEANQVFIGVDALFAYFQELQHSLERYLNQTTLLVDIGATTTHVVSIINGQIDNDSVKRINLGGNNSFDFFAKTLFLKRPHMKSRLSYAFVRSLYERFTRIAVDYKSQLRHFSRRLKSGPNSSLYRNKITEQNKLEEEDEWKPEDGVQIDFDVFVEVPEEEIRRKEEIKKRVAEKLKETIERRKEIKRKSQMTELASLKELKERYESHDKFAHQQVAEMFGQHKVHEKLNKKITTLEIKLGLISPAVQEKKYALLDIHDEELAPEQIRLKRMQYCQKLSIERRRERQRLQEEEEAKLRQLRQNNPQLYLQQLKEKYQTLSAKFKESERIKNQLNCRKSKLKQRKMQAIARMMEEEVGEQMQPIEDDWLVLKDLEESDHYSELEVIEAELRQIDPSFTQQKDHHHLKETNQIFFDVQLFRCHEILFEPKMIGVNQKGISKTILDLVLSKRDAIRQKLLSNILVVGGGSAVPNLAKRIKLDLTQECPEGSRIEVKVGKYGWNGAYLGMQGAVRVLDQQGIARAAYMRDFSSSQVQSHPWANPN